MENENPEEAILEQARCDLDKWSAGDLYWQKVRWSIGIGLCTLVRT
jgi:hypothetical protein